MKKRQKIEPIYKTLGGELRKLRIRQKMTQAELAKRVRLGRATVVNFEAGRQRLPVHKIYAIAKVLGREMRVRFAKPAA